MQLLDASGHRPGASSLPENVIAALLLAVPALLIAGAVLLAGARHLPREMALMLAKLRAAPRRARAASTFLGRSVAAPPELQEP